MSVNQPGIKTDYLPGEPDIPAVSLAQLSKWVQGLEPDDDSFIVDHRPDGIGIAANRESRTLYRIREDEDDEDPGYLEDKIEYIRSSLNVNICDLLKGLSGYAADKILFPVIVNGECRLIEMAASSCDCFCCMEDPDGTPANFTLSGEGAYVSAAAICAALGPGTYKKVTLNGTTYWFASTDDITVEWDGDTVGDCVWMPEGGLPGTDISVAGTDGVTSCSRSTTVRIEISDMTIEDEVCP